jgi:hypothetical protein
MHTVRKKLREARFFLRQLSVQQQLAFADPEEFDFFLSAFLCAGRSIDYRLRHRFQDQYRAFFHKWEPTLEPNERTLLKFMVDNRNLEVHQTGSSRAKGEELVPVAQRYQDKSGTMTVVGPPGLLAAEIVKPVYTFSVDGDYVPVIQCCEKYLDLLERLVAAFSARPSSAV